MSRRISVYLTDARLAYLGPRPRWRIMQIIDQMAEMEGKKDWGDWGRKKLDLPKEFAPVEEKPPEAPKPMRLDLDLEWGTYRCPCGDKCRTDKHENDYIAAWIEQHRPHTNGKIIEHTTADGARIYWDGPPDLERDL